MTHNFQNPVYRTFVSILSRQGLLRPAGDGVKGNTLFWDRLYPSVHSLSNKELAIKSGLGSMFRTEGIASNETPCIENIHGGGFTWDLIVKPTMRPTRRSKVIYSDIKVLDNKSLLFNGNDSFDLFTGSRIGMNRVFASYNNGSYHGIILFLEQIIKQGHVYYRCHALNMLKVMKKTCYYIAPFHGVIEQGKDRGLEKSFLQRYSVHGTCETANGQESKVKYWSRKHVYTRDFAFIFCSNESFEAYDCKKEAPVMHNKFRIRCKPSSLTAFNGKSHTDIETRRLLHKMKCYASFTYYSSNPNSKSVVTPEQGWRRILSVV